MSCQLVSMEIDFDGQVIVKLNITLFKYTICFIVHSLYVLISREMNSGHFTLKSNTLSTQLMW